jgi:hypothetical protein
LLIDTTDKDSEDSGQQLCDRISGEDSSHIDAADDSVASNYASQVDDHDNANDLAETMRNDLVSDKPDGFLDRGTASSNPTLEIDAQPKVKTSQPLRTPSETNPDGEETDGHELSSSISYTQPEQSSGLLNLREMNDIDSSGPLETPSEMKTISDAGQLHDRDDANMGASTGSMKGREEVNHAITSYLERSDEPRTPGQHNASSLHDLTSPTMPQSGSSTRSYRDRIMDQTYRSLFGFESAPTMDNAVLSDHNDQTGPDLQSSMQQDRVMTDLEGTFISDMSEVAFAPSGRSASQFETITSLPTYSEAPLRNAQLNIISPLVEVVPVDTQPEWSGHDEEHVNHRSVGEAGPVDRLGLQTGFDHEFSADGQLPDIALVGTEPDFAQLEGSIRSRMSMVASHILPPEIAAGESPTRMTSEHDQIRAQQSYEAEHGAADYGAGTAASRRLSIGSPPDKTNVSESVEERLSNISVPTHLSNHPHDIIVPEKTINVSAGSVFLDDSQNDHINSDPRIFHRSPTTDETTVRALNKSAVVEAARDLHSSAASRNPDVEISRNAASIDALQQAKSDEHLNPKGRVVEQTPDRDADSLIQEDQSATLPGELPLRSEFIPSTSLASVESTVQANDSSVQSQAIEDVSSGQQTMLLQVDRHIGVNHDDSAVGDQQQRSDLAIGSESIATDDDLKNSAAELLKEPTKSIATPLRAGSTATGVDPAPEGAAATPAAGGVSMEQVPVTGRKSRTRKSISARLGHVPDAISSWFSPRRSSRLHAGEEEKARLANLHEERGREEGPPKWAAMGIATSYSYFVPLSTLEKRLNNPGQPHHKSTIDVLSVVTQDTKKPERAKSGPKDFFTVLSVIDPSVEDPGNAVTVEVFRPYHAQLPVAHAGDIVLLRDFAVKSRKRQPYLLSTDASAWCVWRYAANEPAASNNDARPSSSHHTRASGLDYAREEVKGPPVELGEEERVRAGELHGWWQGLKEAADAPLNAASKSL